MELILTLLLVLVPLIGKLVGKYLENSGQLDKADKVNDWIDTFSDDENQDVIEESPVELVQVDKYENFQGVEPQSISSYLKEKTTPIDFESESKIKREKIDKKKLIIYSEIMKPKFE